MPGGTGDAQAGKVDLVAVGRHDRFSRSQTQQAVAIQRLRDLGVEVVSASQPAPKGAIGDMMRNQYAFVAELEREYIREGTSRGKKQRTRENKLPALYAPKFGYMFADENKDRYLPPS
jgi:DNA invertase Pin-like site-specific DNA recombinase